MLHAYFLFGNSQNTTVYERLHSLEKYPVFIFHTPTALYIIDNPNLLSFICWLVIPNYCMVILSASWGWWSGREDGCEAEESNHKLDLGLFLIRPRVGLSPLTSLKFWRFLVSCYRDQCWKSWVCKLPGGLALATWKCAFHLSHGNIPDC